MNGIVIIKDWKNNEYGRGIKIGKNAINVIYNSNGVFLYVRLNVRVNMLESPRVRRIYWNVTPYYIQNLNVADFCGKGIKEAVSTRFQCLPQRSKIVKFCFA